MTFLSYPNANSDIEHWKCENSITDVNVFSFLFLSIQRESIEELDPSKEKADTGEKK